MSLRSAGPFPHHFVTPLEHGQRSDAVIVRCASRLTTSEGNVSRGASLTQRKTDSHAQHAITMILAISTPSAASLCAPVTRKECPPKTPPSLCHHRGTRSRRRCNRQYRTHTTTLESGLKAKQSDATDRKRLAESKAYPSLRYKCSPMFANLPGTSRSKNDSSHEFADPCWTPAARG